MADPDLELGGGGGGGRGGGGKGSGLDLPALMAFFPSVISSFLAKKTGEVRPPRDPPLDPPLRLIVVGAIVEMLVH